MDSFIDAVCSVFFLSLQIDGNYSGGKSNRSKIISRDRGKKYRACKSTRVFTKKKIKKKNKMKLYNVRLTLDFPRDNGKRLFDLKKNSRLRIYLGTRLPLFGTRSNDILAQP